MKLLPRAHHYVGVVEGPKTETKTQTVEVPTGPGAKMQALMSVLGDTMSSSFGAGGKDHTLVRITACDPGIEEEFASLHGLAHMPEARSSHEHDVQAETKDRYKRRLARMPKVGDLVVICGRPTILRGDGDGELALFSVSQIIAKVIEED